METGKENLSLNKFFELYDGLEAKSMLEKLTKVFVKQRAEYNKDILENILKLKNIKSLNDLHIHALTLRQRLLEDSHILLDKQVELKKDYKHLRGLQYEHITNNVQIKFKNKDEKGAIIEGNSGVNKAKSHIDILDNQILYYNESIKTMDQLLYGLKTRIDVERLLGA